METMIAFCTFVMWLLGTNLPATVGEMHDNEFVQECFIEDRGLRQDLPCIPLCRHMYQKAKVDVVEEMRRNWYVHWKSNLSHEVAASFRKTNDATYTCEGPDWVALVDYARCAQESPAEVGIWMREGALDLVYFKECEEADCYTRECREQGYRSLVELGEKPEGLRLAAEHIGREQLRVYSCEGVDVSEGWPEYCADASDLKTGIYWLVKAGWPSKRVKEEVGKIKSKLKEGVQEEAVLAVEAELAKL